MNFWTYSPDNIQILVAGFYQVQGLYDGTFVEVIKDVIPMTTSRSVDGMVGRKHTTDNTYTINITLYSASPANDLFTKLWQLDELTQMAKFPLLIKDSTGTGFFFSTTTWVEKIPTMDYSVDIGPRVWGLRSSQGVINIGGNDKQSVAQDLIDLGFSGLPLVSEVLRNV